MSITVYDVVEGEIVSASPQISIDAVINGLMGELDQLSQKRYRSIIHEYLTYTAGNPQKQPAISFSNYLGWLREKGLSGSTINVKRVAIRRFYEWAAKTGLVSQSDYINVKSVKSVHTSGSKRGRWLDEEQLKELCNLPDSSTVIGRRDRAILGVLVGCGLRRSEVTALTWRHLVRSGRVWIIENLKRKHGRMQEIVPVPDWVKNLIDQYSETGKPDEKIFKSYDRHGNPRNGMTDQTVYNVVREYSRRIGFEIAPHDARRSFARLAASKGAPLSQLKEMMGHSSESVTERYVNAVFDYETAASFVVLDVQ